MKLVHKMSKSDVEQFLHDIAPVAMVPPPKVDENFLIVKIGPSEVLILFYKGDFYFCLVAPPNKYVAFRKTNNFQDVLYYLVDCFTQFKTLEMLTDDMVFHIQSVTYGIRSMPFGIQKIHTRNVKYMSDMNKYYNEYMVPLAISWYMAMKG